MFSKVNLTIEMVLSFCFYCSPYRSFFINFVINKLINNFPKAPIKSSGSSTFIFQVFSHISILSFAFISILAFVIPSTNNKLFKQFIEAYLKAQM